MRTTEKKNIAVLVTAAAKKVMELPVGENHLVVKDEVYGKSVTVTADRYKPWSLDQNVVLKLECDGFSGTQTAFDQREAADELLGRIPEEDDAMSLIDKAYIKAFWADYQYPLMLTSSANDTVLLTGHAAVYVHHGGVAVSAKGDLSDHGGLLNAVVELRSQIHKKDAETPYEAEDQREVLAQQLLELQDDYRLQGSENMCRQACGLAISMYRYAGEWHVAVKSAAGFWETADKAAQEAARLAVEVFGDADREARTVRKAA